MSKKFEDRWSVRQTFCIFQVMWRVILKDFIVSDFKRTSEKENKQTDEKKDIETKIARVRKTERWTDKQV